MRRHNIYNAEEGMEYRRDGWVERGERCWGGVRMDGLRGCIEKEDKLEDRK